MTLQHALPDSRDPCLVIQTLFYIPRFYINFKLTWAEGLSELFWSKCCPLSLVVVVVVVVNLFTFSSSGQISTKLGTSRLWVKGIQVCSNEWSHPFPRGDYYEIAKIHWQILKIFFSRTARSISTKLYTNHLWMKGIQVCSNEEPFNSHKDTCNCDFFLLLINVMFNHLCLLIWIVSQVSDVVHQPFVFLIEWDNFC